MRENPGTQRGKGLWHYEYREERCCFMPGVFVFSSLGSFPACLLTSRRLCDPSAQVWSLPVCWRHHVSLDPSAQVSSFPACLLTSSRLSWPFWLSLVTSCVSADVITHLLTLLPKSDHAGPPHQICLLQFVESSCGIFMFIWRFHIRHSCYFLYRPNITALVDWA